VKDLRSFWQLYWIFKQERPFIVHTHTPKAGTIGMLAACIAGVPVRLHTVAGLPLLEAKGIKRKLLNWVEKITYACATKIYPNSKGLYNIIIENRYTHKNKLLVIGSGSTNGINTAYFDPRVVDVECKRQLKEKLGISNKSFVFIYVGRLVRDKGINELIQAFVKLNQEYKDTRLLLVGKFESNLDPVSEITLKEIRENSAITYCGYKEDVRPYFAISNTLVFPSYREGFPNVVMQAGAMAKPAIVTDINGCNEIIEDGKNGVIVPPKNVNELYNAMRRFLDEKDLEARLIPYTRKMIVDRYEQRMIWNMILKEYMSFETNNDTRSYKETLTIPK